MEGTCLALEGRFLSGIRSEAEDEVEGPDIMNN